MQTITMEELLALVRDGITPKAPQGGARYFDGNNWHKGYPSAELAGGFTGRAGTMSRSRKGRSTRNANGSRKYIPGNVVAYTAKSVV